MRHPVWLVCLIAACNQGRDRDANNGTPAPVVSAPVDGRAAGADAPAEPEPISTRLHDLADQDIARLRVAYPDRAQDGQIAVVGACVRPDAENTAALTTAIAAWLKKTRPAIAFVAPTVVVGCVEPSGTIVDVQADVGHEGYWWTLRIAKTVTTVIDSGRGRAYADGMEGVPETSTKTLVLADLDRDGRLDVVTVRNDREGGDFGGTSIARLHLSSRAEPLALGTHDGWIELAHVQPSNPATVVLELPGRMPDRMSGHAVCVTATNAWHDCAAAEVAGKVERQLAAAQDLADLAFARTLDPAAIEATLAALDTPAAERARLMAAVTAEADRANQ